MSHAFVKEGDEMWLHEVAPTFKALVNYLTRENNGLRVEERGRRFDEHLQTEVIKMSDGFSYFIRNNRWEQVE